MLTALLTSTCKNIGTCNVYRHLVGKDRLAIERQTGIN